MYWWTTPARARYYFNDAKAKAGDHNTKYAASPSYDLDGNLYTYELGMPVQNFRKYPGDVRMKLYKNLGNSRREGMFIYGYLEYVDEDGATKRVRAPEQPYDLYIRDAVGTFQSLSPDKWPSNKTSELATGDHNSGWHFAKYPFYSDDDAHQMESDYTEIRLPEIIYSLAECKLRSGKNQMPPNFLTVSANVIIRKKTSMKFFTPRRARLRLMRQKCLQNGVENFSLKAVAASTSSGSVSSHQVLGGIKRLMQTVTQKSSR